MNTLKLTREEEAIFSLRSLYELCGYSQFKMSKFEEYDLYVRNKDFLVSDGVITFTDTTGKLLALKPDVTLSIIKNFRAEKGCVEKVYYSENVYRVSADTHAFKELLQMGVECMGEVDAYCIYEVVSLAAKSLRILSSQAVLDISDFGILMDLLATFGIAGEGKTKVLSAISKKNIHDLKRICATYGVEEEKTQVLCELVKCCGPYNQVFDKIKALVSPFISSEKLSSLKGLCQGLVNAGFEDMIRIDFSVVNGFDYYNGIVFKGFVKDIPTWVLSGGQYDRLMQNMDQSARAIGFAVYLDLMEEKFIEKREFDFDCLVLYSEDVSFEALGAFLGEMISQGKSVSAQKVIPSKCSYKELWQVTAKGGELLERNA